MWTVSSKLPICVWVYGKPTFPATGTRTAQASIIQDFFRPELPAQDAVVMMMDARGTLFEIRVSGFYTLGV